MRRPLQTAGSAVRRASRASPFPVTRFAHHASAGISLAGDPSRGPGESSCTRETVKYQAGPFPPRRLGWNPINGLGGASGGLAFTVGLSSTRTLAGTDERAPSHYLTVWRQESDGSWRFIFDLGSPRPAG